MYGLVSSGYIMPTKPVTITEAFDKLEIKEDSSDKTIISEL